jgi:5-methyltetrahydrofolate--homocysteine methyltransferase
MLEGDYESAIRIAAEQMDSGAHALDVCTALTEDEHEAERTQKLVSLLSAQVDAPLVIDSTDPDVMEKALKAAPGRCLLNSINLEGV